MADNIAVTAGSGETVAADEISSAKYQRIKLIHGADGTNDGDVSTANPFPIVARNVIDGTLSTVYRVANVVDGTLSTVQRVQNVVDGTLSTVYRVGNVVDGTLSTVYRVGNVVDGTLSTVQRVQNVVDGTLSLLSRADRVINLIDGTLSTVYRVGNVVDGTLSTVQRVQNVIDGTLSNIYRVHNLVDGTLTTLTRITETAKITASDGTFAVYFSPSAPLVGSSSTLVIANAGGSVAGSTSGVSVSGVQIVAPEASRNIKVYAFSLTTTAQVHNQIRFTNGAGTSPTTFWQVGLQAPSQGIAGANLAVTPPGYLFATGSGNTLALLKDTASLVHYSVSYFKESA